MQEAVCSKCFKPMGLSPYEIWQIPEECFMICAACDAPASGLDFEGDDVDPQHIPNCS